MLEQGPSFGEIFTEIRKADLNSQGMPVPSDIPFFDLQTGGECYRGDFFPTYEGLLPLYKGETIISVIKEILRRKRYPNVLFLEFNDGSAIREFHERYGNLLNIYGITSGTIQIETHDEFIDLGITVSKEDPHALSEVFDDHSLKFDLVICPRLGKMVDQLRVLKEIWQVLEPNGVALLSGGCWSSDLYSQLTELNDYFRKTDFEVLFSDFKRFNRERFILYSVAMEKNKKTGLEFPLCPYRWAEFGCNFGKTLTYSPVREG